MLHHVLVSLQVPFTGIIAYIGPPIGHQMTTCFFTCGAFCVHTVKFWVCDARTTHGDCARLAPIMLSTFRCKTEYNPSNIEVAFIQYKFKNKEHQIKLPPH